MTEHFKVLSQDEYNKLVDTIALLTVYIAGADGEIEHKELEWAEKVTKIRAFNEPENLSDFYTEVGKDYHDRVEKYVSEFPNHPSTRNPILEDRIAEINPILAKLDSELAYSLYNSYVSFAKHVAKATGGFFGFFSVGPKEAELLELKMITPIKK